MVRYIIIAVLLVAQLMSFGVFGMAVQRLDILREINSSEKNQRECVVEANLALFVGVICLGFAVFLLINQEPI